MTKVDPRELNRLIAETIMGWVPGNRWGNGNGQWTLPDGSKGPTWDNTPRFSTDIACAFQVVEALGLGLAFQAYRFPSVSSAGTGWLVAFKPSITPFDMYAKPDETTFSAWDESLPRAICLAALAALSTTPEE